MKKILLSGLLLMAISFTANAQSISKNALGLRFGSNGDFGTEISYQRKLSGNNRLEADFGWRNNDNYDSFKLTGLYQWLWNIDGGFYWYAGAGAGIGSYSHNNDYDGDDGGFATLSGDIGIEYNFDFPLQIALDLRPEMYFGNDFNDNFRSDLALTLRYRFN
ncbi:MAG: hypothetical protein ACI7YS_17665 [Flavobacterium sp.]